MNQTKEPTGPELRDQGMETAIDHADRVEPDWQSQARFHLREYLRQHTGTFMTENLRAWAYRQGCPVPPVERAWGGIVAAAARGGLIVRVGYKSVTNPKAHCAPCSVWQAAHSGDAPAKDEDPWADDPNQVECPRCGGHGSTLDPTAGIPETCPDCRGIGWLKKLPPDNWREDPDSPDTNWIMDGGKLSPSQMREMGGEDPGDPEPTTHPDQLDLL